MEPKGAVIKGDNVYLRPLKKPDVGSIAKWHDDKEIMTMISLARTGSEQYWSVWIERKLRSPNAIYFGIVRADDDLLIGYTHLEELYQSQRLCRDVGILVGEKDQWSKGYGTEAMGLLLRYAFGELCLHRLELMTFVFNRRGIRLWEKCGFKREGVMRQARLANGEWCDLFLYALLEDEYRSRK